MNNTTLDDYKKSVKAQYEEAKTGLFSGFLQNPSPAELKNLCLLLFDKGISKQDQEIFDVFFELDDKSNKRKQIQNANVDKLRPVGNFLKGRTENTRSVSLDLMAVLVDFQPRPYRKFITGNKVELAAVVGNMESSNDISRRDEVERKLPVFEEFKNTIVSKRIGFIILSIFILGGFGYGMKSAFFPDKNCMIWVKNHYEAVNYDSVKDSAEVRVLKQEVLDNFKKVAVCDTTTFFKNGQPLFWYSKVPTMNEIECFNQPGLHPETGKTLKPITDYIINKYIRKE